MTACDEVCCLLINAFICNFAAEMSCVNDDDKKLLDYYYYFFLLQEQLWQSLNYCLSGGQKATHDVCQHKAARQNLPPQQPGTASQESRGC